MNPKQERWRAVCARVTAGESPELLAPEVEGLDDATRVAPEPWVDALVSGAVPAGLSLCRSLTVVSRPLPPASLEWLGALEALRGLTELRLFDVGLNDDGAERFVRSCRLTSLRAFYAPWNTLGPRGLAALLCAPALRNLRLLHLYRNNLGPEGMRVLADEAPPLQSLNVCFNGLGSAGAFALSAGRRLDGLEQLHIGLNEIGSAGLRALAGWSGIQRVKELNAKANGVGADAVGALLEGAPALERMLLEDNPLTAVAAKALEHAPARPLRELQLGGTALGAEGAFALSRAPALPSLTALTLWENDLGDAGAAALLSKPLPQLRRLDLSHNGLGDATAQALISRSQLPSLEGVRLRGNGFGAGMLETLREWARARSLDLQV